MTDLTKRSNICGGTSSFKTEDVVNEFCEVNVVAARRELVGSDKRDGGKGRRICRYSIITVSTVNYVGVFAEEFTRVVFDLKMMVLLME